MTERSNKIKKSIIFSSLVGTSGFFIAKVIGLAYSIPFSTILGSSAYMAYYGSAYQIYSYILNVFTAGFPFAIATLVAKYMLLENYKTVLRVKRLSVLLMGLIGFLGMIVMMALSSIIAPVMAEGEEGVHVMTVVLCILAIAIFLVPILSALRGFIQGCKEMEEYAFSQAFEQLFRVGFLLSAACLMVYGLNMARVWALYAAVLSTSVAAVAGIAQIYSFSRKSSSEIANLSFRQKIAAIADKPLLKELVLLAIPYMISAVLGYSDSIYNAMLLPTGLRLGGQYSASQIDTIISAVNYVGTKLNAIPMVLAPGFTAAIIPHLSSALEARDYPGIRKNVKECINIVLFLGLFLSFVILFYGKQLFFVLFWTEDLTLSAQITRWGAVEGFLGTIVPVVSSIMMALKLQKSLLRRLAVGTVMKGILLVPLTAWLGFPGAVAATVISYCYILGLNCIELNARFNVHFKTTFSVLARTLIGLACMGLCGYALFRLGLGSVSGSKIMCLFTTAINGLICSAVFFGMELFLQVPQSLFHFKLNFKR